MTPHQLSARLRSMADKLDRSARPSVASVQKDILHLAIALQDSSPEGGYIPGPGSPASVSLDVSDDSAFDSQMSELGRPHR